MIRGADLNEDGEVIQRDDDEEKEEEIPETRIDVELPKLGVDLGEEFHFAKLPNFLSVETRYGSQ